MRLALLSVVLFCAGCAATPPTYETVASMSMSPPLSAYSSGSFSGSSTPSAPSAPSVPSRGETSDLVVRPDLLELGFALRETDVDEAQALAAAQATVAALSKQLEQATQGAAKVKMCGMTSTTRVGSYGKGSSAKAEGASEDEGSEDKAAAAKKVKLTAVTVDGLVEVPLAASLDYWGRMRMIAALKQVTKQVVAQAEAVPEGRRGATFAEPRPLVKDPEAHRATLTERWVRRVRSFTEVAQGSAAPLQVVDCTPPGPIEQQARSLEEVALSLSLTCRLNVTTGR